MPASEFLFHVGDEENPGPSFRSVCQNFFPLMYGILPQFSEQQHIPQDLTLHVAVPISDCASFFQFNFNELGGKIYKIAEFMNLRNILIAVVQETKLKENCDLQRCYGYNILR